MTVLSTCISLLLIWVLFFWFYRDYRIDRFRQNLFSLRDELFDLAMNGRIDFDSKAYGMLRSTINGTIQYGHQVNLVDLAMFNIFLKNCDLPTTDYKTNWEKACKSLDEEIQQELASIRDRLHINVLEQIIFTSALLMFTVFVAIAWAIICLLKKHIDKRVRTFINGSKISQMMLRFDSLALDRMTIE